MDSTFQDKVAVVTGAGGTLCSAIAKHLASLGCKVVLVGRTREKLEKVAQSLDYPDSRALSRVAPCDVTDEAAVTALAARVMAEWGPCRFLINGAGGNNIKAMPSRLRWSEADLRGRCAALSGASPLSSLSPEGALSGEAALGRAAPLIVPSLRLTAGEDVSLETLERFAAAGCRVVDISVDEAAKLAGDDAPALRDSQFRVAAFAASRNWTMLLHLGALREKSSRLRAVAGPAGGYAAMRAPVDPAVVAQFLDALERDGALPRTILLTLNPEAHAQLAVLAGSFTREGSPGHVQLGPAWWWCDHAHGVRDVLEKTSAYGVLSTFIGMTTDSRSILSLARHAWFRRTLCRWVAEKVASGDFPDDESLLRPILEAVCYGNAKRIFDHGRLPAADCNRQPTATGKESK